VANFLQGRNCAQSVMMAYGDLIGLQEDQSAKVSAGIGGGLSRLRETCGAFAVCAMVAPALLGEGGEDPENRTELYSLVQQMAGEFVQTMGSLNCAELLGKPRAPESPKPDTRYADYYAERPCLRAIETAAEIIDRRINRK